MKASSCTVSRCALVVGALALGSAAIAAHAETRATATTAAVESAARQGEHSPLADFIAVLGYDQTEALAALDRIARDWHESSAALLVEMVPRVAGRPALKKLLALIETKSGLPFDGDIDPWYEWLWSKDRSVHPDYAGLKARLYEPMDPRFREYFDHDPKAIIRLDEIRWGGVRRDGIPPLKNPKMESAGEARWLDDDHIVFGVAIDGDVRAYPKRILAWHEMFKDRIGGRELAGVYCTLCGALVLYDVTLDGVQHELGTSGFLYRSNKLMYDHATKSLWSTLSGEPVVGPLVGTGTKLESLYVVTTTWGEWRRRHPGTQVLSIDTGHRRNYAEGAAYRSYFATDRLMFGVPRPDPRLANKAEVLALRLPQAPQQPLAIAADFLALHPVYRTRIGDVDLVVLTDASGANRVYEGKGVSFTNWDQARSARDSAGRVWRVQEAQLTGPDGQILQRLPAHRAFWFGWHAAFPDTRLVK